MDLLDFPRLARRWLLLLVMLTATGAALGYFLTANATPVYEAQTRLLVGPLNTDIDTLRASGALTRTYAEIAESDQVLDRAATAAAGTPEAGRLLRRAVGANANDTTRIITIRVKDRDSEMAARMANAIAAELAVLANGTPEKPAPAEGAITTVDGAAVPTVSEGPKTLNQAGLCAIAGLLAGLAIAYLTESLGRRSAEARALARPHQADGTVAGPRTAPARAIGGRRS